MNKGLGKTKQERGGTDEKQAPLLTNIGFTDTKNDKVNFYIIKMKKTFDDYRKSGSDAKSVMQQKNANPGWIHIHGLERLCLVVIARG